MKRRQAYKFEVIADGCQQRNARRFAGACRFVFNKALALQEQHYNNGGRFIRYEEMAKHLVAWKKIRRLVGLTMHLRSLYSRHLKISTLLTTDFSTRPATIQLSKNAVFTTAFVFLKALSSTEQTAASFFQSLAGSAIGTAGKCLAH